MKLLFSFPILIVTALTTFGQVANPTTVHKQLVIHSAEYFNLTNSHSSESLSQNRLLQSGRLFAPYPSSEDLLSAVVLGSRSDNDHSPYVNRDAALIGINTDRLNLVYTEAALRTVREHRLIELGIRRIDDDGEIIYGVADVDDDGYCDDEDLDEDNDGIPDLIEGLEDTDGDGVLDYLDLDSDNDGIPDIIEAGGVDIDGDGRVDDFEDVDGDGLDDRLALSPLPIPDTDDDGIADYLDLDSDNDGVSDASEAGGEDGNGDGRLDEFADVDGDGFSDVVDTDNNNIAGPGDGGTSLPINDFDFDGISDYLDIDSDNDGIVDVIENNGLDADGDGQLDGFEDVDGDGFNDLTDTDNDNIPGPFDGGLPLGITNTDGTGGANYLDIDSDGDGILDNVEGQTTGEYIELSGLDDNGNGLDDNYDIDFGGTPIQPVDFDRDGIPDYKDLNSDGDTENDIIEGHDLGGDGIPDVSPAGTDGDGDGLDDAFDFIVMSGLTAHENAGNGTVDPLTDGIYADIDAPGIGNLDFREIDSDKDGIPNIIDLDNDNDGIPDLAEGEGDKDGDGIVNKLDLDSDNDGIPDLVEAGGVDVDGDGVVDGFTDIDDDGLDDDLALTPLDNPDSDGDGMKNFLDLDSDNDGIPDLVEAGGADVDQNGIVDNLTDVDNDGFVNLYDTDNNNIVGPGDGGTALLDFNSDEDLNANRIDLDSDNDGIPDIIEAGGIDIDNDGKVDSFIDINADGLHDAILGSPLPNIDTDLDGLRNYRDIDADNDGIVDVIEAGGIDSDGNGRIDGFEDVNGNGLADSVEEILAGTPLEIPNTDGLARPNYLDIDSDGDGITDNIEAQATVGYRPPLDADTDGDGLNDEYDLDNAGTPILLLDYDLDLIPDYIDLDSDNDGISDLIEAHDIDGDGIAEVVPSGSDSDDDGLDNNFDLVVLNLANRFTNAGNSAVEPLTDGHFPDVNLNGKLEFRDKDFDNDGVDDNVDIDSDNDGITNVDEGLEDTDGDGLLDKFDLDSDNDGIPDIVEAGGVDLDGDGKVDGFVDLDGDGMDDGIALSPLPNIDTDGDGIKDFKDLDSDNDGIPDLVEAGGADLDGNGIVDDLSDVDNDGFVDLYDTDDNTIDGVGDGGAALLKPNSDTDAFVNRIDLDSDNDGIPDVIEAGGTDANGDGMIDGFIDDDANGFSDEVDEDAGGTRLLNPDTDLDGHKNYIDLDSDNDGIVDAFESGGDDADGDGYLDSFVDVNNNGLSGVVDTDEGGTALLLPNTDGLLGPDYIDIDSDDDGIIDNIEGQKSADYIPASGEDSDGDGIDNNYDINDGGTPIVPNDHDMDGDPDYIDLDTDSDGIPDRIEGFDANGDGIAEVVPVGIDADQDGLDNAFDEIVLAIATSMTNAGNGTVNPLTDGILADFNSPDTGDLDFRENDSDGDLIDDAFDLDADNDGILNIDEGIGDNDNDGIPNILDLDSDNDGIADIKEAGGIDLDNDGRVDDFIDENGDGYDDNLALTPLSNLDFDGDGLLNSVDLDADNDGIFDRVEEGFADLDGVVDNWLDTDNDGIVDAVDIDQTGGVDANSDGIDDVMQVGDDSDGDGIADEFDNDANGDGWDDNLKTDGLLNFDQDGQSNFLDLDSDNDGMADLLEDGGIDSDGNGMIDDFVDSNIDGADDAKMTAGDLDFDEDLIPNYRDVDSDNDGVPDVIENGLKDLNVDGRIDDFIDANKDGWDDVQKVILPTDTDADGEFDMYVKDADNDGLFDVFESDNLDADLDGIIDGFIDENADGLKDGIIVYPPDTDGDLKFDFQDTDSDDDSVPDSIENDANKDGTGPDDTDKDGILDFRDTDDDNDGILTISESSIDSDGKYADCDLDGIPDYLDPDLCNLIIPQGFSPNDDGINENFIIRGIEKYPNAEFVIFNRWGQKVYESKSGYANDWSGENQFGGAEKGTKLPAGTYFYVLSLGDDENQVIKDYIYLNR
ncbi:T9SS type B sorting domain-containing protein [Crocinitomix catalasitica]|uniref:T9SS type B sorting domain-containing protein n=1 Tax=Crocinitomix catalasitica TaxID=184607 RepID=UPI00146F945C|nr:gliding motility-associated C-terminal domain-containing protein [Crocinitomix catalasitica]